MGHSWRPAEHDPLTADGARVSASQIRIWDGLRGLSLALAIGVLASGALPSAALATCTPLGSTVTCTGDESGGIAYTNPDYDTLNVNNLTNDITPASGFDGVSLTGNGGHGDNGDDRIGDGHEGDPGHAGEDVTINYDGDTYTITTTGDGGQGIIATANGGNGGKGGTGLDDFIDPVDTVGGNGGKGGNGGNVSVTADGTITTSGDYAHAILATSEAGNGGEGGHAQGAISSTGGDGGVGGTAGTVYVDNSGNLTATGEQAVGIYAKAVGGAGGDGGSADGIFGGGGAGKGSGPGGAVTVSNSGIINTGGTDGTGILAMSVGGFAGSGGTSVGLFAYGASEQSAGAGAAVIVDNSGNITTNGVAAAAIDAESVGGGGGNAGTTVGLVAIGASGESAGGNGGTVNVSNTADLTTLQGYSEGINAQSIGGGGGKGGTSVGLISIGGSGGTGGDGQTVHVENSGNISTGGEHSDAIFAQSIGGGGGKGGASVAVGAELSVAVGGSGGDGGAGGNVYVNELADATSVATTITTSGAHSGGVVAQSTGGGGGKGGWAVSASAGYAFDLSVGKGGSGGSGGDSGIVVLGNNGVVQTTGDHSGGLLAQSVAGGGGYGGFDVTLGGSTSIGIDVGVGGGGGTGGNSDDVTVSSWTDITTQGDHSAGIEAESTAGGGGHGGFSITGGFSADGQINVSVGGGGGGGGDAKSVTVASTGNITTSGDHSAAILAGSTGGGGGNAGFSINVAVSGSMSVPVTIGGGGGSGGAAEAVTVTSTGALTTGGASSSGLLAQSVGGGGGNGGFAISVAGSNGLNVPVTVGGSGSGGGHGGVVEATSVGAITTIGHNSSGIFAQSLGGGGGNGGFSITGSVTGSGGVAFPISVGGSGGTGDYGSAVTVSSIGAIQTGGDHSAGIFAQSLGGGGGNGGFSIEAGFVFGGDAGNIGVSVGGKGSSAADAGTVMVTSIGGITTDGELAPGIFAQSVGGNGGNGGFSVAFNAAKQTEISVSVGGGAGSGGAGKDVTVSSTGTVFTKGSKSYGIEAQSVGGGGGNGGFSVAGSFSQATNIDVSVGGGGGNAGSSGVVTLTQVGSVYTEGSGAHAILAQSLAGGGGTGGFSGTVDVQFQGDANIGVSVGGHGGSGGMSGDVTVTAMGLLGGSTPIIGTLGEGAAGIFAQSLGGSGGDGGFSFVANIVGGNGDGPSTNIGVSVGGGGSNGGQSGNVEVTNANDIVTVGGHSYGIQAQSQGGAGGNGGMSVSGDVNLTTTTTNNLNVAVGGSAGGGNISGTVDVDNGGAITTLGFKAAGILAQSVGGDGGNGGLAFSGSLAGGGTESAPKNIDIAIGGGGGDAGHSEAVTITNSGFIDTWGHQAQGILAQSVGGDGGTGGLAGSAVLSPTGKGTNLNVNVSVGGGGGSGGAAEKATVNNSGDVFTRGVSSTGIYAQSVGGNGGVGGSSFTGIVGFTKPGSTSSPEARNLKINVAIGGAGGDGATAGAAEVTNSGTIVTTGGSARGIMAQSIGGNGGSGGAADAFSMQVGKCGLCSAPDFASKSMTFNVSVGGAGGDGNHASTVTVNNSGAIQTDGAASDAIYAHSIGGGGGDGGNGAIGLEGLIGIPGAVIGDLVEIVDPPIEFWKNISVSVGGSEGANGNGGVVSVTNTATLITGGSGSSGIFAQSIGGGGGQGGNSNGGAFDILNLGGSSSAAGDGDTVTVVSSGGILTEGEAAYGVFAQSIGGGGGKAGSVAQNLFATGANVGLGFDISLGGGAGGNGAAVNVTNSAVVATTGDYSHGIWAQSVGGGGGLAGSAGFSVTGQSYAGSNGDEGDAGDVTVVNNGDVFTAGTASAGIFAQSASGGADGSSTSGADDYAVGATGTGKTVSITTEGAVYTEGEQSNAIVAQSVGLNGNGDMTVTIGTSSVVMGGTDADGFGVGDDPTGVTLLDGKTNLISNRGTISTQEGYSGTALLAKRTYTESSNTTVVDNTLENWGTVTGSIFFGGATNTIDNFFGSRLNMGVSIDLAGGTLTNEGTVSPGGYDQILTTDLTGNFVQLGAGTYEVDVDFQIADAFPGPGVPGESDLLHVTGYADLDGIVSVNAVNAAYVGPDSSGSVKILTADGGYTNPTLFAPDSEIVKYGIEYDSNNQDVYLTWDVNFDPAGLNRNETAVAEYIIAAITEGDPVGLNPVINALLEQPDLASLRHAYDQLTPEPYIQATLASAMGSMEFGQTLLQCPGIEDPEGGSGCVWAQGGWKTGTRNEVFEYLGSTGPEYTVRAGIGSNISKNAGAVIGFSYDQGKLTTQDIAEGNGQRVNGGFGLNFTNGGATLAIAGLGGAALYDTTRYLNLLDPAQQANGQLKLFHGGGQVRFSAEARGRRFRLTPAAEAWTQYLYHTGIHETGADGANLIVQPGGKLVAAVHPTLTLAAALTGADGSVFQPFVTGGATYFFAGQKVDFESTLEGDDTNTPAFTTTSAFEPYYIDAAAGFDLKAPNGAAFRISGSGKYAPNYLSYGGYAKFVAPF